MRSAFLLAGSLLALAAADRADAQAETKTHGYDSLGRLVTTVENDGDTRSTCFDQNGNREVFRTAENGTVVNCPPPPPVSPPPSPPTQTPQPPPPPSNLPPSAVNDFMSGPCDWNATINLTANDTDPEGQALTLVSIGWGTGTGAASAMINSASTVFVDTGFTSGNTNFIYTVRDPAGATDTATLSVTASCSGGGMQP